MLEAQLSRKGMIGDQLLEHLEAGDAVLVLVLHVGRWRRAVLPRVGDLARLAAGETDCRLGHPEPRGECRQIGLGGRPPPRFTVRSEFPLSWSILRRARVSKHPHTDGAVAARRADCEPHPSEPTALHPAMTGLNVSPIHGRHCICGGRGSKAIGGSVSTSSRRAASDSS